MTIKFGIIGTGRIANRHAEHINDHESGKVVGSYDIDTDVANEFSKKFNVRTYPSITALLNNPEIDVVNICSPNGLHAEHAIQVLEAGKHVVIEKPMALKKRDCEEVIQSGLRNNKQVFIVKQNR